MHEGKWQLLIGEHQLEILQVNASVVATPLFWVNIPTACEHVGLSTEFSGVEMDYHVEL